MVGVDAHPDRAVFLEDIAQRGRDALRQENRNARAEADELDVLDRTQARKQMFEFIVGEEEGIAAGEEHVPNFGMRLDVAQALFVLRVKIIILSVGNQTAARAVATIGGAAIRDQKE